MTRFYCAVAIVFLLGSTSRAQEDDKKSKKEEATLRQVQGTVSNTDGKPIVGAIVHLKDLRTLQIRSYITRDNGEYHFTSLKLDDDYEIEATNRNMTSGVKKISTFDTRKILVENLKTNKPEKKQ